MTVLSPMTDSPAANRSQSRHARRAANDYNATVTEIRRLHDALMIIRVEPDGEPPRHEPGQFSTLGLRTSEPRTDGRSHEPPVPDRLILRAYSISCPIFDATGGLIVPERSSFLEFYIALVLRSSDSPPALTPRLFAMQPGHRIYLAPEARGHYTLHDLSPEDDVLFLATGTGEAPHNAMIRRLLAAGHAGRIGSLVCVRYRRDLGYLETHRRLEDQYPNYRYLPLTTREVENIDPAHPGYVGKLYLQDLFADPKRLESALGWRPDPARTHVYLCGNPSMIGSPRRVSDGSLDYPDPPGMIETLIDQGFRFGTEPGTANVHYERYW